MTIQEICDDWAESSSNIDGKELSVRTFHRISYLDIVCERQLLSKRTLELIIGQHNISHGYSCKR